MQFVCPSFTFGNKGIHCSCISGQTGGNSLTKSVMKLFIVEGSVIASTVLISRSPPEITSLQFKQGSKPGPSMKGPVILLTFQVLIFLC